MILYSSVSSLDQDEIQSSTYNSYITQLDALASVRRASLQYILLYRKSQQNFRPDINRIITLLNNLQRYHDNNKLTQFEPKIVLGFGIKQTSSELIKTVSTDIILDADQG